MKRIATPVVIAAAICALVASAARRAVADDETNDTEIRITAPLEAADCSASPPTITVLGLSIDVSNAAFDGDNSVAPSPAPSASPTPVEPADDSGGHQGSKPSGGTIPGCYYYCPTPIPVPAAVAFNGCASLIVGQPVEIRLGSDAAPLVAAEVNQQGADDSLKIAAPVQSIDPAAQSITLLGLTIDTSTAELQGADDHGDDASAQPIDLTQLLPGQFVEAKLAGAIAPLVASEVEVKNFTNQLEVELQDRSGDDVDDVDDNGNAVDDVDIEAVVTVAVQNPAAATGSGPRRIKRLVTFHTSSSGHFTLTGLPTGRAKILVVRSNGGVTTTARRSVPVKGNTSRRVRIRLHPSVSR